MALNGHSVQIFGTPHNSIVPCNGETERFIGLTSTFGRGIMSVVAIANGSLRRVDHVFLTSQLMHMTFVMDGSHEPNEIG
ncbi:unnamed protein product [Linum tenue]|uniref:Dirigent protein n=1 Tax=Linum tenue TaxID=586396 RepID=A0AAV0MHK3_9ROSI|nr:unnamed protein product [Linum tenue]